MELPPIKRIIEAALLASVQPLTLPQLSGLFDAFETPSHDDLAHAVIELQSDCAERGVELVEVASGFRYQVRHDVHVFVARLWSERPSRYSRALLETLSLIAYRQPITRAEIELIRGVAVSTNIVRTLEEREWVRVVGYRDLPGKPALLGTTRQFLDYFNLKSLDQLPPLSEIREIEELDPQLTFGPISDAIPAGIGNGVGDTAADPPTGGAHDLTRASNNWSPALAERNHSDAHDVMHPEHSSPASEESPAGTAEEDTPEILV